jgi:16S rRNA (guanine527-N7)-methyltransferase
MTSQILNLQSAYAAITAHQEVFNQFAQFLAEQNQRMNLTRIDNSEQVRIRHFLDSLAALDVLDDLAVRCGQPAFSVIDVGSGAGFPGLAIGIARPEWKIFSLEATEKKANFQQKVCKKLGLANVTVVCGRAETVAHDRAFREQFCAVTARALAGLNILAELTMAFVRLGGMGLFWKGPQVQKEIVESAAAFETMGASMTGLRAYQLCEPDPALPETTLYLALAEKRHSTPEAYPRQNYGAIKKRPLS